MTNWQSNCLRHPQNAKTIEHNLSDDYHVQYNSSQNFAGEQISEISKNVPKSTLFCFRAAAVETFNLVSVYSKDCTETAGMCVSFSPQDGSLMHRAAQREGISSYCRQSVLRPWSTFCYAAHFCGLSTKFCPFTFKKYSEIFFNKRENNDTFKDPLVFL